VKGIFISLMQIEKYERKTTVYVNVITG